MECDEFIDSPHISLSLYMHYPISFPLLPRMSDLNLIHRSRRIDAHPAIGLFSHHLQITGPHPPMKLQCLIVQAVPFATAALAPLNPFFHFDIEIERHVRSQVQRGESDDALHGR